MVCSLGKVMSHNCGFSALSLVTALPSVFAVTVASFISPRASTLSLSGASNS